MSDEVFRIVISVAVLLACIAFLVQAGVVLALYRSARKLEERVDTMSTSVSPLIEKLGPMVDRVNPVLERIAPMMDRAGQTMERLGPVIDKSVEVIGAVGTVVQQASPIVDDMRLVLSRTNQIIADSRPRIAELSDEAVLAARSAREQVQEIGGVVSDFSQRARARVDQIDHSVENTFEQVEHVGDAMKRAVLRPVREANGIAAGISAAMSTLVKGPRKSSPDNVTQDEEMFI